MRDDDDEKIGYAWNVNYTCSRFRVSSYRLHAWFVCYRAMLLSSRYWSCVSDIRHTPPGTYCRSCCLEWSF
jgi:hypothetical protein